MATGDRPPDREGADRPAREEVLVVPRSDLEEEGLLTHGFRPGGVEECLRLVVRNHPGDVAPGLWDELKVVLDRIAARPEG